MSVLKPKTGSYVKRDTDSVRIFVTAFWWWTFVKNRCYYVYGGPLDGSHVKVVKIVDY